MTAETLPAINATLNAISTVLLLTGLVLVKRKKYRFHATAMLSAVATSTAFLICYLIHKAMFGERSIGLRPGLGKNLYLFGILLPHVLLAVGMLPLIGLTLWRAYQRDWLKHRRIAPLTLLIWLYVSVTGVLIYFLLYHFFPVPSAGT